MKVSRAWLQTYFDTELPAAEMLADALTFHAFEIEEVISAGEDSIIDVKVTPNRGHDCLCHRGIAKELSVILKLPLKSDPFSSPPALPLEAKELEVEIADPKLCRRFTAAVIQNVTIGPSPAWLQNFLQALGQRSINNVVDATNYVMFNLGQPLHAFDADKLTLQNGKRKILVRTAKGGESFTALDGKQYVPTEKDLFITDGHNGALLGIAGVKGGKLAEVDSHTKNLVIEAANFDRTSIRKTSQRLKLRTDASQRFENEISPELTAYGLKAVADLITKIAGGEAVGFVDVYPNKQELSPVSIALKDVNGLLGTAINAAEMVDIFKRFGFIFTEEKEVFLVTPPFERLDLVIKEDLVEEVGRIHGYANIQPRTPELTETASLNKRFFYSEKIRDFLLSKGFSEVYTSSFRNEGAIELANAVASDKNFLRKDLHANITEVLAKNAYNAPLLGLNGVRVFEIGAIFPKDGEVYALAFGSWEGESAKKEKEATNCVTSIAKELGELLGITLEAKEDRIFEIDLGSLIEKLPDPVSYTHLEISSSSISYKPFSPYPFALRDIALWAARGTTKEEIASVIKASAGELLVRLDHFDSFEKGEKVSHAFHLVFQSQEKTLSDEEVTVYMNSVYKAVKEKGWEVR